MLTRFWLFISAGPRAFATWLHAAFCALMTPDGLKAWALIMSWGCSIAMTAYATYALWLVRDRPGFAFWLGTEAMGILLLVITGIMYLLGVKRDIGGDLNLKDGTGSLTIKDKGSDDGPPAAA